MSAARRKTSPRGRANKNRRKSVSHRFITSPLLRRIVLIVVVVGLLYVFMPPLTALGVQAWRNLLEMFGVGLGILVTALGLLVWQVWRVDFFTFIRRGHRYLGGAILALALWGVLAFFHPDAGILQHATLGGEFGQGIIGDVAVVGVLRIAGLILLGIVLIAPRWTWHGVTKLLRPHPLPRVTVPQGVSSRLSTAKTISSETSHDATQAEVAKSEGKPVVASQAERSIMTGAGMMKRRPVVTAGGWQLPPIDILEKPAEIEINREDVDKKARLIEQALDSYGVEAKISQINMGPTVTQFGLEPGWDRKYKKFKENGQEKVEEISRTRIRVDRITSLANDLSLALAAPSIRIEAPIPGKSMVGIEVPNSVFGSVALRSVIETPAFQKIEGRSRLAIALGKGAGGEAIAADLAKMPHLLIAGATGSGKTVCLDSIICCLLLSNSPDDVKFVMVDPKRVELVVFNSIPHLAAPVVVDSNKAVKALRWLSGQMDKRYRLFAQAGTRNIEGYNKECAPEEKLPYLVLVIDELADLMMLAFDEVERTLCRLAQLSRATGIHLIVATQRPSVDVVTGLIKANFPTRISFAVTSQVDSRTILDMVGAEKLLGKGDMLYMPTDASRPKRLQGSFISDVEMDRLVNFWGNQMRPEVPFVDFDEVDNEAIAIQKLSSPPDALIDEARRLAREHGHISSSFLQRRLRVGYPRAARLMETLTQEGLTDSSRPGQES